MPPREEKPDALRVAGQHNSPLVCPQSGLRDTANAAREAPENHFKVPRLRVGAPSSPTCCEASGEGGQDEGRHTAFVSNLPDWQPGPWGSGCTLQAWQGVAVGTGGVSLSPRRALGWGGLDPSWHRLCLQLPVPKAPCDQKVPSPPLCAWEVLPGQVNSPPGPHPPSVGVQSSQSGAATCCPGDLGWACWSASLLLGVLLCGGPAGVSLAGRDKD